MLVGWGSPTRAQMREQLSAEARPGQGRRRNKFPVPACGGGEAAQAFSCLFLRSTGKASVSWWPSGSEQKGHTARKELMWPPQAHHLACPSLECPGVRSGTVALGRRPQGGWGSGGPLFLEEAVARQVETVS